MAADIVFPNGTAWSTSSVEFVDLMQRAATNCRQNESELGRIFREAEEKRCLDISKYKVHSQLIERLLEAARDKLRDFRAQASTQPEDIGYIEELIRLAGDGLSASS